MAVMPIPEPSRQEGTVTTEVADRFWGDRSGSVRDPFGHEWPIAPHVVEVTAERAKAATTATAS